MRIGVAGTERCQVVTKVVTHSSAEVVVVCGYQDDSRREALMFAKKRTITGFRDGYATCADFCEVFQSNDKQFYLLAYLLTADHWEAEECLLIAMDESFNERNVFRGWQQSWSKRCVIRKALSAISSGSRRGDQQLQGGVQRLLELELGTLLATVVRLEPAERVVFVATVLERYSVQECGLLLGRPPESVKKLKLQAIGHLSEFVGERIRDADLDATEQCCEGSGKGNRGG